jgi:hypothetical protein
MKDMSANRIESQKRRIIHNATAAKANNNLREIPPRNVEPVLVFAVVVGVLLALLGFVALVFAVVGGVLVVIGFAVVDGVPLTVVKFRRMVV